MAATKTPYKIEGGCPHCENKDAIEGLGGKYICTSCEREIDSSQISER
jgi:hypothetical protein